ncbi:MULTISPECIES: putative motility protein [unclassified Psychrobacillus]|uniref:putative motility protein n=1 Tax=unclassified Psychrobacillus TaxID=2636677 RepID=UPI002495FA0D|nr:putative motility protein [Psychrobacillus sp. NEAU-3TGS]MDI2586068.1 putative motility protein [Psychrobacillus sp. NEAU-3TGS]
MDLNSIMSSQLIQLQQTVQMSVLQNAMNMDTVAAVQMLQDMPETAAPHPYKGTVLDIQA